MSTHLCFPNPESTTLIARSLFPVNPLCVASQSIGVCRQDIEGNKDYGIGRVISPSILLHGSLDFVIMLAAFRGVLKKAKEENDKNENKETAILKWKVMVWDSSNE